MDSVNYEYWRRALDDEKKDQVLNGSDDDIKVVIYDNLSHDLFFQISR